MTLTRRRLIAGAGTAAAVATVAEISGAKPAGAVQSLTRVMPMPSPVPGFIYLDPSDTTSPEIHLAIPGPPGKTSQIFGFPTDGMDAESTSITNFDGHVAYGIVAGTGTDHAGETVNIEADIRVMQGRYLAEDGSLNTGTFAFF